jgi:hypothetical protein
MANYKPNRVTSYKPNQMTSYKPSQMTSDNPNRKPNGIRRGRERKREPITKRKPAAGISTLPSDRFSDTRVPDNRAHVIRIPSPVVRALFATRP